MLGQIGNIVTGLCGKNFQLLYKMYNGIGLQTPRGSGTNGHVQRNWAIVRKTKDKVNYKTDEGKLDQLNKQPNKEILDHVRKRKVEVKCAELADILEEQGLTTEEVTKKVESYRSMLMGTEMKTNAPRDEFGRINVRETHQIAEAQQEKNAKLREAFGISEFFVEGSSLDPERRAREAEARAAANKVYELVRTPSPAPDTTSAPEKKNKRKRSGSTSKKKKGKKHKKERSESPRPSKKKEKSKKKKKEKKHKKVEASSSDSESSDDTEESCSSEAESKKKKKKKKKKNKVEGKEKYEKKKAALKRKHVSSDSSTDSSPERPKKSAKHDKVVEKNTIIENETSVAKEHRSNRSPKKQERSRNETPPVKKKESSTKKTVADKRDKSPIVHKTPPPPPPRRHRSPSRSRVDRGRSPRRYSRSRRVTSSPRRRRMSRSPRRYNRFSISRSRSRSRYDRYVPRRRLSPVHRRRRSDSRKRSRSPRRPKERRDKSQDRRKSRSRSKSRSRRSSLSYSPVRKNPERYKDILDDKKKKDPKKERDTRQKSRSISKSRKIQTIAPRVSLRSSSEDEGEIADDEPKQEDEEKIKELNTLKRLQSGLAAKARETLGKKVISPVKVKLEKKEESVFDIALPVEPPKAAEDVINPSCKEKSNSPVRLLPVQSPVSSRSPSPALPLTREEAAIKIRSPSESPPPLPQATSLDKTSPKSPTMSVVKQFPSSGPSSNSKKSSPIASQKQSPKSNSLTHSPATTTSHKDKDITIKLRSPSESPPFLQSDAIDKSDARSRSPSLHPGRIQGRYPWIRGLPGHPDTVQDPCLEIDPILVLAEKKVGPCQRDPEVALKLKNLGVVLCRRNLGAVLCRRNQGVVLLQKNAEVVRYLKSQGADLDQHPECQGKRIKEVEVEVALVLLLARQDTVAAVSPVRHDQRAAFLVDLRAQLPAVRVLVDPVHHLYRVAMVRLVFLIDVGLQGTDRGADIEDKTMATLRPFCYFTTQLT
ncbi:hypothetical protein KPH14_001734 [Odynerus spinipes]|uniref:CWF21 domain-containing protein n=1 Tax=Odynerus spinipes TaxID=1348599 RepID=A0AAD9S094_9HYME|nr:hypothetical protein KPH14_001734 [Odynerus spinipes]